MTPIRFLFDYLSPYAYLAWAQLPELGRRHARAVEPVPVLLAGLLNASGGKGPAEVPAERAYLILDISRISNALSVPLSLPPSHPFNPLLPLRATLAAPAEARGALVSELFTAVWGRGEDITRPEAVLRAAESAELDGRALLERAGSSEGKEALRAATEQAVREGVFGVPSMQVDGSLFWGCESLPYLERYLGGKERLAPKLQEQWRNLRPSASR
jgi:2-hydroxychromene-2-carboxylate isomerase